METILLLIGKSSGAQESWLGVAAFAVLVGMIGAGVSSLLCLRSKVLQKEKRIADIIKNKTEALYTSVNELTRDNEFHKMLSMVAMHTENCVFITDADGEIIWANPGFTRKTGYTLEKFKNLKGNTIMEASCNPNIIDIINQALTLKKSVAYDSFAYTKYCKKFYISSLITPIFNEQGDLERFVIIDTDISNYVTLKGQVENITREFSDYFQEKVRKIA